MIIVKYNLGIEIDAAFWYSLGESEEAAREEYAALRESMVKALNENNCIIPDFDYLPEQATLFKDYVLANEGKFYTKHGFAKYLDINRLVDMFSKCTPAQMNEVRSAFHSIYRIANVREFFLEDQSAISVLLQGIELTRERLDVDRVQLMHYKWFIESLTEIKKRLS